MKNQNRSNPIPMWFIGIATGISMGTALSNCGQEEDFEKIQDYNHEIEVELQPEFKGLEGLVLTEDDEFRFHIDTESHPDQNCEGDFEVIDEVAKVSGQVACTQVTELSGN